MKLELQVIDMYVLPLSVVWIIGGQPQWALFGAVLARFSLCAWNAWRGS